MSRLIFPAPSWSTLLAALESTDGLESAAILLVAPSAGDPFRVLVHDVVVVPSAAYEVRTPFNLTISQSFLAAVTKRARLEHLGVVLVHTHPGTEWPTFSPVDQSSAPALADFFIGRSPTGIHGFLVLGGHGFEGRVRTTDGVWSAIEAIDEVGPEIVTVRAGGDDTRQFDAIAFDRNVRAFGEEGQARLSAIRVAIVGLGGIGSIVLQQLAHLGVMRFLLLDHDKLEASNLNRVVGARIPDVGRLKVDVARDCVSRIRPDAQVTTAGDIRRAQEGRRVLGVDFMFGCTDSHGSRAVVNQLAYQHLLPTIDMGVRIDAANGSVARIVGRVQMLAPSLACLVCEHLLDPDAVRRDLLSDEERAKDPYIIGSAEPAPAVISINGVVASLAVTMFLGSFLGLPVATRHQMYLGDEGVVRRVRAQPHPECVVCSSSGVLARGDTLPMPWR